jgi:glutathione S-transferase
MEAMADGYRIFGSEMSPYSVKVRSYVRFKGIPHEWIPRRPDNDEEYRKYARLPIVPTVVTPQGDALQDSTPIIEYMDALNPEPSIHPADPSLAFIAVLLEEFGDEWGNKLMFHHRWWDAADQQSASLILARLGAPDASAAEIASRAETIRSRMTGRGGFVGSSHETAELITKYFFELVDLLERHLQNRPYLLGARPCFGDFGLAAQLYEASVDPTCSAGLRARGPAVLGWCYRMLEPRADGPFESWEALQPTLQPVIAYVGRYFLPWSAANSAALKDGSERFSVALPGGDYVQAPQKYHAKSLAALRSRYSAASQDETLRRIMIATGCESYLA